MNARRPAPERRGGARRMWAGVLVAAGATAIGVVAASGGPTTDATRPASAGPDAGAPTTADATRAAGPGCRFVAGQNLAFDFRLAATMDLHAAAMAPADHPVADTVQHVVATSEGALAARVLAVTSAGDAIVALRATAWQDAPPELAEAGAAYAAELTRPSLLRIDAHCHVVATARHRDTSLLAYDRIVRLVDALAFEVPSGARPALSKDVDTHGVYVAENTLVPAASGRGSIQRRRTTYVDGAVSSSRAPGEPALAMRIVQSAGRVALGDAATPWFASLEDRATLQASYQRRPAIDTTIETHVTARGDVQPGAFQGTDLVLGHYIWGRPDAAELRAARDAIGPEALRSVSAADAWRTYKDSATKDWFAAQKLLRAWLRANPDGARQLAAELRAGHFSEAEQAALMLALAKADTPVTRGILESLAADTTLGENLRTQATSALGDVPSPTLDTVRTLTQLADRTGGASAQDMVGSAATLSLGTLLAGAPTTEVVDAARGYLDARLSDPARTRDATTEALWAVGNAGDNTFFDAVEPLTTNDDPDLRGAAIHAVRKMTSDDAGPLLAARLKAETHPEVASEIASAQREQIGQGAQLSPTELNLLRSKFLGAPEPLRRELVLTLGAASRNQPEARAILAAWYPNETSLAVQQLIGQFVPASELTTARTP